MFHATLKTPFFFLIRSKYCGPALQPDDMSKVKVATKMLKVEKKN